MDRDLPRDVDWLSENLKIGRKFYRTVTTQLGFLVTITNRFPSNTDDYTDDYTEVEMDIRCLFGYSSETKERQSFRELSFMETWRPLTDEEYILAMLAESIEILEQ